MLVFETFFVLTKIFFIDIMYLCCKYIIKFGITFYIRSLIMPSLTIRLSEEQLKELKRLSKEQYLTVTELILKNTIPHTLENVLYLDNIIGRALNLKTGEIFNVKSLFTYAEWNKYTKSSRISSSRNFFIAVNETLKDEIEFIGKDTCNLSIYKRK